MLSCSIAEQLFDLCRILPLSDARRLQRVLHYVSRPCTVRRSVSRAFDVRMLGGVDNTSFWNIMSSLGERGAAQRCLALHRNEFH